MRKFRLYKVESGNRVKDPVIVEGFLKAEEKSQRHAPGNVEQLPM